MSDYKAHSAYLHNVKSDFTYKKEIQKNRYIFFSLFQFSEKSFSKNIFITFHEYTTKSTGFTMENANQAAEFNNFHEGIHLGIILQIRKFL